MERIEPSSDSVDSVNFSAGDVGEWRGSIPVKCTRKHQVIIHTELVETLCEISLVDQTTSLVNYYKGEDSPKRMDQQDAQPTP